MRARILATVVTAMVAAAPATAATADSHPSGPAATIACKHAKIGGKSKCIARGQYCARRYERDYERYGLHCTKRDANGRYHLR